LVLQVLACVSLSSQLETHTCDIPHVTFVPHRVLFRLKFSRCRTVPVFGFLPEFKVCHLTACVFFE